MWKSKFLIKHSFATILGNALFCWDDKKRTWKYIFYIIQERDICLLKNGAPIPYRRNLFIRTKLLPDIHSKNRLFHSIRHCTRCTTRGCNIIALVRDRRAVVEELSKNIPKNFYYFTWVFFTLQPHMPHYLTWLSYLNRYSEAFNYYEGGIWICEYLYPHFYCLICNWFF